MTIELDEGTVARTGSSSGPSLYYASAMPTGGARAVLAMVPGYADHGGRYAHVMGALAEHGIGSVAIDLSRLPQVRREGIHVALELWVLHGEGLGKAQPGGANRRRVEIGRRKHAARQGRLPEEHRMHL